MPARVSMSAINIADSNERLIEYSGEDERARNRGDDNGRWRDVISGDDDIAMIAMITMITMIMIMRIIQHPMFMVRNIHLYSISRLAYHRRFDGSLSSSLDTVVDRHASWSLSNDKERERKGETRSEDQRESDTLVSEHSCLIIISSVTFPTLSFYSLLLPLVLLSSLASYDDNDVYNINDHDDR